MADAYTTTAVLNFDQVMWDRAIYYGLRPQLYFDQFADVGVTDAAPGNGASVTFTTWTDMAAATTALSETVDVDAVALADTQTTLTLAEYGNAVTTTFRVRATAFAPIDPAVANLIGYNAGLSQDTLARNILQAGTNVRYAGAATSRVTVAAGHIITADLVRRMRVDLVSANVAGFGADGEYAAFIHPDVAYDLRREVGAAAWRDPHTYSQPSEIWNGEIGTFEGFRFMESPRAPIFVDGGVGGTVDVYRTLFMGRQALAKAYSTYEGRGAQPIVIMSPVVDSLKRLQKIGWHWYGAFGVFRQAALRSVESASSIGAN